MKNTLIVPFDQNCTKIAESTILRLTVFFILLFLILSIINSLLSSFLLINIVRIITLIFGFLLLCGWIYSRNFLNQGTAAILNQQGIWIQHYNLIAWNDISEINTHVIAYTPIELIGIQLKDSQKIFLQASLAGKCNLFWAKIFKRHYHIPLSNLALKNEDILNFANWIQNKK